MGLGNPAEGILWIEQGIRDIQATSSVLSLPAYLARKAGALYLADRTSEALEAINEPRPSGVSDREKLFSPGFLSCWPSRLANSVETVEMKNDAPLAQALKLELNVY